VRAVKLESTPSGTYSNSSQGLFITLNVPTGAARTPVAINSILPRPSGMAISWNSLPGSHYRVAGTANLTTTNWPDLSVDIIATATSLSWTDLTANAVSQRFYRVFQLH